MRVSPGDRLNESAAGWMMGGTRRWGAFAGFSFVDGRNWENEGCSSSIAAIWMIHYMIVLDWTSRSMLTADADFLLRCHSPFSISASSQCCALERQISDNVKYYGTAANIMYDYFSCSAPVEMGFCFWLNSAGLLLIFGCSLKPIKPISLDIQKTSLLVYVAKS